MEYNPQCKGITLKTRVATPKKPNSAKRPIAKINLMNLNSLNCHIPGIGHNLRKHSLVLIRGGNVKDLPGISYKCIRGVFDLAAVQNRITQRSLYGVKKPEFEENLDKFNFLNFLRVDYIVTPVNSVIS